jgi:Arc/MetJ family transcription regulator
MHIMRTNLILDDDLVRQALQFSRSRTKTGLVAEALRTFIGVKAAERQRLAYGERVLELDRRLAGLELRQSPSEVLRRDRERR